MTYSVAGWAAVGFAVGFGCGALAMSLGQPVLSTAPVEQPERPRTSATHPDPDLGRTLDCPEGIASDRDCARALAFARGQLKTYEGIEQAWPTGVAREFREASLEQALRRAWANAAEVQRLDCEEYPCLVTFRLTTGDDSCCTQLYALLPETLSGRKGHSFMYGDENGVMHAVIPFGDDEQWSDEVSKRTTWRVSEAGQELIESVKDVSAKEAP